MPALPSRNTDRQEAQGMQSDRSRVRSPLSKLVKGSNLRLLQRLGLAFLLVTLLGAGTSAAGLWFTNTAAQSVQTVQRASEQIQGIERLQREWFRVVSSVDLLLLTRSLSGMQGELEQSLANFQTQLATVAELMAQTGHAADIQEAQQIALELNGVMDEFYGLIRTGRWGNAQTVRYAKLSTLQTRLEASMSALNQKIQADVDQSMAAAQRTQALARGVWAVAALLALAFSAAISWYSSQAIAKPIEELTHTVEKVTAGGVEGALSAITPPERKDEIGEMWRAFATLTEWLGEAYQSQEKRIEERTRDLERRRMQVQAAAEVARDIIGGSDTQEESFGELRARPKSSRSLMKSLLDKSVDLIRDRFGFYHAGIFLIDGRGEYALLRAATGQAGEQMVANHHRLKVGQAGLVGMVAQTGQPRIALDVDKDPAHFRNPMLPETRSEVALPLRSQNQIIGVLDVQSQESDAFDQGDITILQIIADQLATAIENRRLVNELEIRLQELESFTAEYGRMSWERLAQLGTLTGLEYDGENIKPLEQTEAVDKYDVKYAAAYTAADKSSAAGFHRFPLKLRDEVIANLDVWPGADGLSAEDTYLLENFTGRISQILESARLFNEAQQRATREQLLNQLTSTIVRSIEPQAVLQAAVQQLEQLPAVARAAIYLTPSAGAEPPAEHSEQSTAASTRESRNDSTPGGLQI